MSARTNTQLGNAQPFLQAESGAIISQLERGGKRLLDQNNFITALWLRELRMRCLDQFAVFDKPKALALDYLEQSASSASEYQRAYGFWADDQQPDWAKGISADVDDTAIVNHELLIAGRISRKQLKPELYHLLNSLRVPKSAVNGPLWIRPGCYYTWFPHQAAKDNIVDVCANTNVVALLANLDAKTAPGYQAACSTITHAINWAADNSARLGAITPYYPSPYELLFALEHAIQCGANELMPACGTLTSLIKDSGIKPDASICSGAFANTVWQCNAIEALRYQRFDCVVGSGRYDQYNQYKKGGESCKF